MANTMRLLREYLPLKQGLRPLSSAIPAMITQRVSSIKTRIKTATVL